ncbi:Poly(A) polymerase gamma [Larimichthys crocea]|uniref:polynucleotide adenylyltransferase n=1 Tax=Larimichthys crocea TaxID=215358 RepID=A0A6G0I6F2_LARCR|nr:Poly(A) polymerase gamma [Larimichthys crocea]
MTFKGIEMDLVFSQVQRWSITVHLNLLDDSWFNGIDKHCARSLNGRNINSNSLGFLGGVSWAIMVAWICQLYPNAAPSTLVKKFFWVYTRCKSPSLSVSSQNTKRPSDTQLESLGKRFRPYLNPPTVEVSEVPPNRTRPVTVKKQAIKFQLLRYSAELR